MEQHTITLPKVNYNAMEHMIWGLRINRSAKSIWKENKLRNSRGKVLNSDFGFCYDSFHHGDNCQLCWHMWWLGIHHIISNCGSVKSKYFKILLLSLSFGNMYNRPVTFVEEAESCALDFFFLATIYMRKGTSTDKSDHTNRISKTNDRVANYSSHMSVRLSLGGSCIKRHNRPFLKALKF